MNSPTPRLIILTTHPGNLSQVVAVQKHALDGQLLRASPGDLLLLAEIQQVGTAQVRYAMRFKGQYPDTNGETERLWGRRWRHVVEGEDCRELDNPFSPEDAKVSSKNYGRGGPVIYVDPEDAKAFLQAGLLKPALG